LKHLLLKADGAVKLLLDNGNIKDTFSS
jgi:hypothetical protein